MSRKPAPIELAGGKGLRQRVWDRIRAIGKGKAFDLLDVVVGGEASDTARDYLRGLERAGYLSIDQKAARVAKVNVTKRYKLARDAGIEAPRVRKDGTPVTQGLAQEQMWRTLRLLKGDTNARELAAHASTATIPVAAVAAADYLRNLNQADYVECTVPSKAVAQSGKTQARYRLKRNTGPRPPMVCRTKSIYDPNLGKIVWQADVTDEDAIYVR